jgi:peptidoglycan/LPS O-acetylase OafA/YrhL
LSKKANNRVYFPGLNGLRFFAAIAVMLTHIELMKKLMKNIYPFDHGWIDIWGPWVTGVNTGLPVVPDYPFKTIIEDPVVRWYHPIFSEAGPLGVVFFFVLSGFLITYLLLAEKDRHWKINIKAFYWRRILRIWPLYFLIFVLGFLVLPLIPAFFVPYQSSAFGISPDGWSIPSDGSFWGTFFCYLFIVPNLATAIYGSFPAIGQSWSIGVEEQFYLVWPLLLRKTKRPFVVMVIFFLFFLSVKVFIVLAGDFVTFEWWDIAKKLFAMSKLECMAMGGIGAWVLYKKKDDFLKLIYHPLIQVGAYFCIGGLLYFTPAVFQNVIHLAYGVVFLIIIINVSSNPKAIFKFEHKWLNTLGRISFGIYMYHMLIIIGILSLVIHFVPKESANALWVNLIIYSSTIGLTIVVSYLSYMYFEKRFIKKKKKYTKVISGDEAKEK